MKLIRALLVGSALTFTSIQLQAALATWTFSPGDDLTVYDFTASTVGANISSANLNVAPNPGTSLLVGSGFLGLFPAGQSVNGSVFTFTLTASGASFPLGSIDFSYNRNDAIKSPNTINWSYNVTGPGGGSGSGSSAMTDTGIWSSSSFGFSGVTLNSGQTFTLAGTLAGGGNGNGGFIEFDNFVIAAVPEPVHVAMALFGVIFLGFTAGRKVLRRA
jgi:hypothetical protein